MAEWNKTLLAKRRLKDKIEIRNGESYLKGTPYHIIGRDTPIIGGAYIGGEAREIILVAPTASEYLSNLYEKVERKSSTSEDILKNTLHTVKENFTSSNVDEMIEKEGIGKDQMVALDLFIYQKTGVCRHKALTSGAILELFKQRGILPGEISIDRNFNPERGGHAWVRYTTPEGQIYILDTSLRNGFLGSLEEAVSNNIWPYNRPTDKVNSYKK